MIKIDYLQSLRPLCGLGSATFNPASPAFGMKLRRVRFYCTNLLRLIVLKLPSEGQREGCLRQSRAPHEMCQNEIQLVYDYLLT